MPPEYTLSIQGDAPVAGREALIAGLKAFNVRYTPGPDAAPLSLGVGMRLLDANFPAAPILAERLGIYAYDTYTIAAAQANRRGWERFASVAAIGKGSC